MTDLLQKYSSYLRYEKNYSLHTEISYLKDLSQFKEFLDESVEGVLFEDVHPDHVRLWITRLMEQGVAARSVNRKLSALKSFYRFLIKSRVLGASPLSRIVGPKAKKPIPSFVNDSDMTTLLNENVDYDDFELCRNHTMLELFYVTGMRRAELIGLKDEDVDFSSDQVKVTGKRNKQRLIPFGVDVKRLLEKYVELRDREVSGLSGSFFVRENGQPLYPMLVYRIVREYLEGIGTLDKASPHVLRHSFATGMLNNGAELNAVKELLGHSSLASTEVYTHTSFEELKKVYKNAHPRN